MRIHHRPFVVFSFHHEMIPLLSKGVSTCSSANSSPSIPLSFAAGFVMHYDRFLFSTNMFACKQC